VADNVAVKNQLVEAIKQHFPVLGVEDKFTEPRPDKAGYPSTNVQVQLSNGESAEVQIVTPEIQAITDQTHRLYTDGRNLGLKGDIAGRNRLWGQAAEQHEAAIQRFKERTARVEGVPKPLTHAPPGRIEEAASTGRPNQGGLGVFGNESAPLTSATAIAEGDRLTLAGGRPGVVQTVFPKLKSARAGFDQLKSLVPSSGANEPVQAARSVYPGTSQGRAPSDTSKKRATRGGPSKGGLGVSKRNGRKGKQSRLRELGNDPKVSSADRGQIKRDQNEIARRKRSNIRVPGNQVLAHRRGKEARKGYGYKYADLQNPDLHRLQHKHEGYR